MPSNNARYARHRAQGGFGMIEALVGSVLLAVALVVLLGSLGSVLVGARVAQDRASEQRLAASRIEWLHAQAFPAGCQGFQPGPATDPGYPGYTISASCAPDAANPGDPNAVIAYTVTAASRSDAVTLQDLRAALP